MRPATRATRPAARVGGELLDARAFAARVLLIIERIPRGRAMTYGDVAAVAGRARGARAVARVIRTSTRADLPYQRVVGAGGRISGDPSGAAFRAAALAAEGVTIRRGRIANFARVRWTPRLR